MQATRSTREPGSADAHPSSLLRLPGVLSLTGLGRSTIYRLMAEQRFPTPVRLSARAVGWRLVDVQRWSLERPTAEH